MVLSYFSVIPSIFLWASQNYYFPRMRLLALCPDRSLEDQALTSVCAPLGSCGHSVSDSSAETCPAWVTLPLATPPSAYPQAPNYSAFYNTFIKTNLDIPEVVLINSNNE
jgi:hypothetical protein